MIILCLIASPPVTKECNDKNKSKKDNNPKKRITCLYKKIVQRGTTCEFLGNYTISYIIWEFKGAFEP